MCRNNIVSEQVYCPHAMSVNMKIVQIILKKQTNRVFINILGLIKDGDVHWKHLRPKVISFKITCCRYSLFDNNMHMFWYPYMKLGDTLP